MRHDGGGGLGMRHEGGGGLGMRLQPVGHFPIKEHLPRAFSETFWNMYW